LVVADAADRRSLRRRLAVILAVLGSVGGLLLIGRVLAADPVGYQVPVWPFADGRDRDENRQLAGAVAAAREETRRHADLSGVPAAVRRSGADVLSADIRRPTATDGTVLLRVRLRVRDPGDPGLPGQERCRAVLLTGQATSEVVSRRITCPPTGPPTGERVNPAG
jgi:hypothetical protein